MMRIRKRRTGAEQMRRTSVAKAGRAARLLFPARTQRVLASLNAVESAREHARNALQLLSNLLDLGTLDEDDRKEVRAAMRSLWTALREIEHGNL